MAVSTATTQGEERLSPVPQAKRPPVTVQDAAAPSIRTILKALR
jgi:hypothetical protein